MKINPRHYPAIIIAAYVIFLLVGILFGFGPERGGECHEKSPVLNRIASGLALIIGAMAIFAGGKVLLGILPDYYVVNWLPTYNFIMGVISVFFSSIVIWKNNKLAMPASIGTFGMHAMVMLILQTAYREVVAPDSTVAMVVRLTIWVVMVILLIMQKRKNIFRDQ